MDTNLSDVVLAHILKMNESVTTRLQTFPDPPHRDDEYVHFVNDYMPMVFLVSFLLAVAAICKDIVLEKEKKLKVLMIIIIIIIRRRRRSKDHSSLFSYFVFA